MKEYSFLHNSEWLKKGFIYSPNNEENWWKTHAMAPAPILFNEDTIRIFIGGWDKNNISRIGYIDVDSENPEIVKNKSKKFVLDIGVKGCFDDNGIFPGHIYKLPDGRIFLYYTGFQKLHEIPFSNFSGLAISIDGGNSFKKYSKAPIMDRADEGLYTRAGQSIIYDDGIFKCCYSAGSSWYKIENKNKPVYEVMYIESANGVDFSKKGEAIVKVDLSVEHGLGRPQIVKLFNKIFVFFTRRTLDFKYFIGCAHFDKKKSKWIRIDNWFNNITHGAEGQFDSEMVYFPSVIDTGKKIFMFYNGNGYGLDGIGFAVLNK
ncbi:MAG: hypothetical protein CMG74_07660 [Candidatus Marinimicrobia bacterium]|nr:hypothetical protein [Candidatus Neomarinimicrobiota bacterium]|tara:strand:+ start:1408 stop:2361 length:954 start_codon:yes stop_codon:yes gene_type:complete